MDRNVEQEELDRVLTPESQVTDDRRHQHLLPSCPLGLPQRPALTPYLRKALGATLSITLALSPLSSSAQTALNQKDPASLLVGSMSAHSTDEARAMLERAKSLLALENLAPADEQAMRDLINQAVQNLPTRSFPIAYGGVVDPTASSNSPDNSPDNSPKDSPKNSPDAQNAPQFSSSSNTRPADSADQLQRQLKIAPEIQNGVRNLGEMRLLRDSTRVDQNVVQMTGQTPQQIDQKEQNIIQEANQAGDLLSFLRKIGLLRSNFAAENKALLDQYQGSSLDSIANQIISRAVLSSTVAGATRALIPLLGKNISKGVLVTNAGSIAGLTLEAASTFIINANLTLQIADLYGVRLNSYEEEVAVLAVFALAKIGVGAGANSAEFGSLISKVASRLGDGIMHVPGSGFNFLGHLLKNPLVARNMKAEGLTPSAAPASPTAPSTAPGATGATASSPATSPAATSGVTTADPSIAPESKVSVFSRAWKKLLSFTQTAIPIGAGAAWANIETRIVGKVAISLFSQTRQRERATQNDLFRQFMMSPGGDGFLKLMILSINVGRTIKTPDDFDHPVDPRVKLVLNLARSARICSPLDREAWKAAKAGQLNAPRSIAQRILKYDCDNGLSSARYVRIKTEFQTFNEIPQDFITSLRTAGRENRLRMGEILLQMQFLDGDRSPAQVLYFNDVVSRYLGLSSTEEINYFNRLHSFIVDNGGMTVAETSPTGYTIGSNLSVNPYDLKLGYTSTRGPEAATPLIAPSLIPAPPLIAPQANPQTGTVPNAQAPQTNGAQAQPNTGVTPGTPAHPPLGNLVPGTTAPTITIPSGTSFTPAAISQGTDAP